MHSALLKDLQKYITSYFKIKKNLEQSGFTLIELLVVIAIMGILTGGAIVAYNNFSEAQTVKRAALQVKTDLRESQNRAVSGLKHEDCRVDDWDSYDPPTARETNPGPDNIDDYNLEGHFVVFDEAANTLYKIRQACVADTDQDTALGTIYPGSIESVDFPGDVTIENVRLATSTDANCILFSGGELTINFKPLKGVDFHQGIDLSADIKDCSKAEIIVTDQVTRYEIEVSSSGQIIERKLP